MNSKLRNAAVKETSLYYSEDELNSNLDDYWLLGFAIQVAMPDWLPDALEWMARAFTQMYNNNVVDVADAIADRLDDHEVPMVLLEWCIKNGVESYVVDDVREEIEIRLCTLEIKIDKDGIENEKDIQETMYELVTGYELPSYELELMENRLRKYLDNKIMQNKMKKMILNNMIEYAHNCWKDGDVVESDKLNALIDRLLDDKNATIEDWSKAIECCTL